ncbi:MAG: hypothetical protein RSB71_02480 [Bacilli bacterium]
MKNVVIRKRFENICLTALALITVSTVYKATVKKNNNDLPFPENIKVNYIACDDLTYRGEEYQIEYLNNYQKEALACLNRCCTYTYQIEDTYNEMKELSNQFYDITNSSFKTTKQNFKKYEIFKNTLNTISIDTLPNLYKLINQMQTSIKTINNQTALNTFLAQEIIFSTSITTLKQKVLIKVI